MPIRGKSAGKTETTAKYLRPSAKLLTVLIGACLLVQSPLALAADTTYPFWPTGTGNLTTQVGSDHVVVGGPAGWDEATDTPTPFEGKYEIFRSLISITETSLGEYIGSIESSAASRTFEDHSGIPGESYHYGVVAVDLAGNKSNLAPSGVKVLVTAATTTMPGSDLPHDTYAKGTDLCRDCHKAHGSPGPSIMRKQSEMEVCYTCHDGTGASTDIQTVFGTSTSGHLLEDTQTVPGSGLTQKCSSCHALHFSPSGRPSLYRASVNGTTVAGDNYTWCEACHNDSYDWVVPTYPYPSGGISASRPSRDASGYPALGTYAGRTTYNNTSWNAHNPTASTNVIWPSSGRSSGDCRNCHASHGNTAKYDALVATFRPSTADTTSTDLQNGTYAELCLTCHDGSPAGTNIKQFVTYDATKTGDDYTGGHRIFTSGGNLPQGAPLPCYDCHNPHGTKGNNGTQPNKNLISDEQWSNIDTSTTAGVVNFCFKCHLPWEYAAGSGEPEANTVPAGQLTYIEGLDRRVAANKLSLNNMAAAHSHTNMDTPSTSCYDCHGNSYAAPSASTGFNVHRPNRGGSCTSCHGIAQDAGDGAPTRRAMVSEFSLTAHHVGGGTVTDNDCGVCHMEGTAADGSINNTYHKNNSVNLRDPDAGTAIAAFTSFTRDTGTDALESWVTNVQNNLCFKCHDSGGAGSPLARTPTGSALRPFSANTRDAPNIYDAMASGANRFHHAVRAAGTNDYCIPSATNGNVVTMEVPWNQNSTHDVISCFDCHVTTTGHGGSNQNSGRTNFATYTGQRDNCIRCHKTSIYQVDGAAGTRFPDHGQSQHIMSGGNTYGCRGCHSGYPNDSGYPANGSPGNIHGGAYTWPAQSRSPGQVTLHFIYGGWMSGWEGVGTPTCWGGNCNHGGGGGRTY